MSRKFIRRNRVDERLAVAIAAGSGVAAALSGARPTGSTVLDVVIVALAAAACVWASASAQWWALASVAGVSAVVAFDPIVAALGGVAFFAALNVGTWRTEQTAVRTLIGGVTINLLFRSQLGEFLGLSAIIGIAAAVLLFVLGLQRRPSAIRRPGWLAVAGVGGFVAVAMLAVLVAALSARPDVTGGAREARDAIRVLNDGEYVQAAQLFENASTRFSRADSHLGGVIAAPGLLVPVVAQNLRSGADLSTAAAEATAEAAAALRNIDPAALRLRGGRIDLEAVAAVEAPLLRVNIALSELRTVVDDIDSPWLLSAVQDELNELDDDFAKNEPRLQNAIDAVQLAPEMLGAGGERRYLMLFTTPSEARGLGGFVGNYAMLEIRDGELGVAEFGRASDLEILTAGTDCSTCAEDLLQKYGPYGLTTGPNGTVGTRLFANITMPAHFPYIAEAVSVLYPQATGNQIDGVIVADPYTVQALMAYTGPIEVPELDTVVQPEDAADFILFDQYLLGDDRGVRIEALETLATGVIDEILRADLPEPPQIARDLGPLIAERRLLMWTVDPVEQTLLDRVGLLGSIPPLDPQDGGFSVSVTNASANKIDSFLARSVLVRIEESAEGRQLVADVVLRNDAPSRGLPSYVIGNEIGLPDGYSRLLVTFYGPPTLVSATMDGEDLPVQTLPEAGWTSNSTFVDFAPGQERAFRLTFSLPPTATQGATANPTLWEQPLADRS